MPSTSRRKKAQPSRRAPRQGSLDAIFRPRSVAVIGASRKPQSIGHEILRNLIEFEFTGPVYPVNPHADVVRSMKCYRRIADVPGPVDLAVIVVPSREVIPLIDQCGRKGIKGVVVITAGFKEIGGDGVKLEEELARRVRRHGMRMVGPNCMGVVNTEPDYRLNATFAATVPARGNVGFVSQSGALGEAILADAAGAGIGVSMFVSMGNKADISGNDFLEYWEKNDDVQVVLMYLESFGHPQHFTSIARRVTRRKPILTVKAGRTAAGARAASSHTGSIVGRDIAVESLLEQCGVMRVSSLQEMFVQATALANQPLPAGRRIALVTNAGGPGILCTDACVGRGLELAEFRPSTRRALAKTLPPEASTANPVDMIATADATAYRSVLKQVKADPNVDAIIAIFVSPIMIDAFEVAKAIAEAADGGKPILSVFMGKQRSSEGVELLENHRVPAYRFPEEAASAMQALVRYRELRDRPRGREVRFKVNRRKAAAAIQSARKAGRTHLTAEECRRVAEAYGLPLAPSRSAASSAEAIAAAQELGYPVVLKALSDRISHKTDIGGVRVDLRNADEVGGAFNEIMARARKVDAKACVEVQPMVPGGHEVILGMTRDPQFGPLLMFGLGGIHVEIMRDIAVRIHPVTDRTARSMIEQVKGYALLTGARGDEPVHLPLIEKCLLRLSQLVTDFQEDLDELDLNPFIVTSRADRSFIVDVRISLQSDDEK